MNCVFFEYFLEDGYSKISNNGDHYNKGMLVAHLLVLDGAPPLVFKASCMCTSYVNFEGNFYYDGASHPFFLDISSSDGFSFKMDTPFGLTIDPSVYSLIAPSSSGGTSSGTVDLTSIQNDITALSSKIDGLGKYNLLDLDGQFGSYRNGLKVLIEGKTEEYEVLSSFLAWSSYLGALVIFYNLKNSKNEICPSSHPFLSLAPTTPKAP